MKNYCTLLLLFLSFQTIAQTSLKGKVTNTEGEVINGASVIAYPINEERILGFNITDSKGNYMITLKEKRDSVRITVRSLGYEITTQKVAVEEGTFDFKMKHSDQYLKELQVKTKPITEEGDTLNYTVATFSKEGDESIEDVLKRLPGVEVSEDGKIQYQGKAINKLYVEGKDLMGSQYAVTTKNLPKGAVASVEILKNHQPVKMLKDVVNSVDPAINIVLKEGVNVTGSVEMGGGVPYRWLAKATPMVFNKKHQTVNVFSSTNSGRDELSVFNGINLFDYLEFGLIESQHSFLLGKQPLESTLFEKSEYNDHQTHSVTTNYITGFWKGDMKVNIDAYFDERKQGLASNTLFFSGNDTIDIHNLQQSTFHKKYLKTKLTYEHNDKKNYFKNTFHFKVLQDDESSEIYQNEVLIPQQSHRTFYSIGDKLSKIQKIGKAYYKLNAYFEYTNTPEQLSFTGGPLTNLSFLEASQKVQQEISQNHLKAHLGTNIIRKWKKVTFNSKLGVNYEWKSMTSDLPTIQETTDVQYQNDLQYHSFIPKITPTIEFRHKKLYLSASPKLSFQYRKLLDDIQQKEDQITALVFEPSAFLMYNIEGVKYQGNYSYNTNFMELPQMYSGLIIHNYSEIKQQDLPILKTEIHQFRNDLSYELPVASLNFYASYEIKSSNKDWITKYEINEEGVTLLQTDYFENNHGLSQQLKGNFDWFLLALRSTFKGSVAIGQNEENIILNDQVNRNRNEYLQWEAMLDFPIIKGLVVSAFYTDYHSKNTYQEMNQVDWSQSTMGANVQFSYKKHLLKWNNKWIDHTFVDDDFLYMDFSYRYQFNKKTSLSFVAQNLLDYQFYTQTDMNAFQSNQSYFYLRPRQLMMQVKFKF
ncbi:carboxypeptidase-like regulatory domain-containing protein [Flammeovirga aprica]|uniref:TonB-dependent receptor n=1 Tax=Flammeovirga aprica JL-4 TaxID=694437 RepID=A0A7X9P0E5_9BACT|nr:carboxypeptidase-like regulatory domain-containing protein [Flammeovirga aprica]NME67135.1 TonB-dependent receptor [Flammeovirga aprica JL-4]